jgi:hypothetical protein
MRRLLVALSILALGFLFMSLAEAALTASSTGIPPLSTLLVLGSGLVGMGVYGRRRFKK